MIYTYEPRTISSRYNRISSSILAHQNGTMKVTYTETMFTMTGKYWSGTYPLSELPKWLSFYQRLREDFPKSGRSYDMCIEKLDSLSKELKNNS